MDLERAAHIYGEAENACSTWALGITEHKYGSEVVELICNVALITPPATYQPQLGAALPLRGENDPQARLDIGDLGDLVVLLLEPFLPSLAGEARKTARRAARSSGVPPLPCCSRARR